MLLLARVGENATRARRARGEQVRKSKRPRARAHACTHSSLFLSSPLDTLYISFGGLSLALRFGVHRRALSLRAREATSEHPPLLSASASSPR